MSDAPNTSAVTRKIAANALAKRQARKSISASEREALEQTLSAWLAFQGDRQRIAEYLHVHPQTVSYRHQRLRELFGDALQDPHERLALQLVLGLPPTT